MKTDASIIVCTYNAENRINNTLSSLINQNYPKNKYEIIVVDDCSKDKTCEIVSKFLIKLIKHKKNKGLAAARNTGLRYAKGEIYICFDDDCIADKNWLKNILSTYNKKKDIVAVCGFTSPLNDNITGKYLWGIGYGNPSPKEFRGLRDPLKRFCIYIKNMINPIFQRKIESEVFTIAGANSSFKLDTLRKIKGWNGQFRFSQDVEICERINKDNKNAKFIFNPEAKIKTNYPSNFFKFLKNSFLKGGYTIISSKQNKKIPQIFPFSFLILILLILIGFFNLIIGLIAIIILPLLFYFWWPIKFFNEQDKDFLLFPYIQFLHELSLNFGILFGYLKPLKNDPKK